MSQKSNQQKSNNNGGIRHSTLAVKANAPSKSKVINSGTGGRSKVGKSNKMGGSMSVEDALDAYGY